MGKPKKYTLSEQADWLRKIEPNGFVYDPETLRSIHWRDSLPIEEQERIRAFYPMYGTISPEEAMDRHFVEETAKPKRISGTHRQILDRAERQHKDEWPLPGSVNGMLKRVNNYRRKHKMGTRPPRRRRKA